MKGINVLELIFAMFILIIVTLVLINIFSRQVSTEALPKIDDFKQAYGYEKEVSRCRNLCAQYTSDCEDLGAAVRFCQEKVKIDIDGNYKVGEKGHFGVVNNRPYCEDGLYCFHLMEKECACGSYVLNPENCKQVMMDYYTRIANYGEKTAKQAIYNAIQPGECEKDPNKWTRTVKGFTPYKALGEDEKYGVGNPPYVGADFWWRKAGYPELISTETTTTGGTTGAFTLTLQGCTINKTDLSYFCAVQSSGTCNTMRFRVVDRSNNEATDINPTLVANAKLNGIFDQISAPLVDGLCNAFFTCMDNNLKAEASNCDIVS
jgi:hypothetical protein